MDERHCKTCVCGCTCGFGGEHVEDNPRCVLTAKRPTMTARETTLGALTAADLGKQVEVAIRFGASVVGLLWRVEHRPDGTRVVLGTDYEMVVTDEPDTPVTVYDEEEA